jgi:PilZ domain-containing protein
MTRGMQHQGERRATGVRRVPVERIVDVCATSSASGSAFQGWSVNVSGRGMSVRATHLPDLHAPVVVRFQEHGSEVIAEGEVAWRAEKPKGAEFGVRFTALDSRSVQALKALCQAETLPRIAATAAPASGEEEHDTEPVPPAAVSVKLHIDGLAAPMQARVRQRGPQRLALGSQLEFLRVGRHIEVEDSADGERRRARIDDVDVCVDPETQVPELIVSLCYEAAPPTVQTAAPSAEAEASAPPAEQERAAVEPDSIERQDQLRRVFDVELVAGPASVVGVAVDSDSESDADAEAGADSDAAADADAELTDTAALPVSSEPPPMTLSSRATTRPVAPSRSSGLELDGDDLTDEEELPGDEEGEVSVKGPSLEIEESDGGTEAERLRQRLDGVLDGLSAAARAAGQRCRSLGESASRGASWVAVRAQDAGRSALAAQRASIPRRRTAAAPRATLRSIAARSTSRSAHGRPGEETAPRRSSRRAAVAGALVVTVVVGTWLGRGSSGAEAVAKPVPPASAQVSTSAAAPVSSERAPTISEDTPSVPSQRPRLLVPPDGEPEDVSEPEGVVAQVPLFGPTSISPAVSKTAPAPVRPEPRALARREPAEPAFEPPAASARAKTKAPAEFGSGRMHLPIIHRLRLDQPGVSLRGERTPTGFDVIIPGRKVMESGTAIARRDPRIAKVSTKNGSDGTHISFRFRSGIPGYKVRLRKDYVEFFISER